MTIAVTATGATVAAAGANACVLGIASGAVFSGLSQLLASGSSPAAAAAVGVSTSTSAILAALTTKTVAGSVLGAVSGGSSAVVSAWIASVAGGQLGAVIVGTEESNMHSSSQYTFDCWKPVLREKSVEQSTGIMLKDLLADERIKKIYVRMVEDIPEITMENKWQEKFSLKFMALLGTHGVAAHAKRIS